MAISFPLGTLVDIFYQIGDTVKQVKGTITSFDDNFVQIKSEDSKDLKKIKISTILEFTEISNNSKQETEDKNCNNNVENQKTKILEKMQAIDRDKVAIVPLFILMAGICRSTIKKIILINCSKNSEKLIMKNLFCPQSAARKIE